MRTIDKYGRALIEAAATQVADLWAEQLGKPLNKDNGDANPTLFMLSTMLTQKAQQSVSAESLAVFKASLVSQTLDHFTLNRPFEEPRMILSADYGPDGVLTEACQQAGIDPNCIPWKSITEIHLRQQHIGFKFGYSAKWQFLPIPSTNQTSN